jgi:hypothetical protein
MISIHAVCQVVFLMLAPAALALAFLAGEHVEPADGAQPDRGAPRGYMFTARGRRLHLLARACQVLTLIAGFVWVLTGSGTR